MPFLTQVLADLIACLRFYSRLPVPVMAFEEAPFAMLDFKRSIRMLPAAGAILGAIGGIALWLATAGGLPPLPSAALAMTVLVLATGAFHEDGLADTADGLGGGSSVARKLEIMRDSRIGTYGGVALVLSLLLRVTLLAELLSTIGPIAAAVVIVSTAATSRTVALMPLALLPPARTDGAAYAAMHPGVRALAIAGGLAVVFALLPLAVGLSPLRMIVAVIAMVLAGASMTWIAKRQIGGQTGDVAGACQQVAEIAFLCVMASHAGL
ncbi:MAG: hypothetical protein JWM36_1829 [Hyphomicrobiales bacterium]|nr:hypothetical protein [Hyphomicrobiales bacterium]